MLKSVSPNDVYESNDKLLHERLQKLFDVIAEILSKYMINKQFPILNYDYLNTYMSYQFYTKYDNISNTSYEDEMNIIKQEFEKTGWIVYLNIQKRTLEFMDSNMVENK